MCDGSYSTVEIRRSAVNAVARGVPMTQVAESYNVDRITVFRWVQRVRESGEGGLYRQPGSGRPRKLQELSEDELRRIVLRPASCFGFETDLWTVKRLRRVIRDEFQI